MWGAGAALEQGGRVIYVLGIWCVWGGGSELSSHKNVSAFPLTHSFSVYVLNNLSFCLITSSGRSI